MRTTREEQIAAMMTRPQVGVWCSSRSFFIILGMLIPISAMYASAQNTFPATGNAGIGTTTPAQPLEVNGAALLDGGGPLFLLDANHGVRATGGQGVTIFTYGVPSGIFLQQVTGNVGIGTQSPATPLHIVAPSWNGISLSNSSDPNSLGTIKQDPVGTYVSGKRFFIMSDETPTTNGANGGIMFRTNNTSTQVFRLRPWSFGRWAMWASAL